MRKHFIKLAVALAFLCATPVFAQKVLCANDLTGCTNGVISPGGAGVANPTATAGPTTVNGSATTGMRSDGAPAIQLGTSGQKGIVQVDGSTITASSGVISTVHNGTVTSVATDASLSGGTCTTTCTLSVTNPISALGTSGNYHYFALPSGYYLEFGATGLSGNAATVTLPHSLGTGVDSVAVGVIVGGGGTCIVTWPSATTTTVSFAGGSGCGGGEFFSWQVIGH